MEQIQSGQANIEAQLKAVVSALAKQQAPRRRPATSSAEESDGDELDTTVNITLGAGHTPVARSMQRSKARRVSLEERAQRVTDTARSANREVLGLDDDRLRAAGGFLSSIADEMDEDDSGDGAEHKVNTQHNNSSREAAAGGRQRLVVKRSDKRAASSSALHPFLFSPTYDESEPLVSLLSKSLSAGVKSKKKFSDKKQLMDLLAKGREHAIDADGLTQRLANSNTAAWLEYESYLWQLLIEKGWEAADWYHRQLFERIHLGRHDLVRDGPVSNELIRELDRQYSWLSESQLASRKPTSSSSDRFRSKTSSSTGSSGSGSSKQTKQLAPFAGVPCKHHGANARHTTAECKDPKHTGTSSSA